MFRTVPVEVFVALPITAFAAMIANLVLADRLYQIKCRTPWLYPPSLLLVLRWLSGWVFGLAALASIIVALAEHLTPVAVVYAGVCLLGIWWRFIARQEYKEETAEVSRPPQTGMWERF